MERHDHFRLKSITRTNIPFVISWIIVFIWLYAYFLPFGGFRFESDLYNLKVSDRLVFTSVWLISAPLITVLVDGRVFVRWAYVSVVTAVTCFLALRATPAGWVSDAVLLVGSACIGHIFAACCYTFFMVLNNTEKFYAMLLAVMLPKLLLWFKPVLNEPSAAIDAASVIILVLLLILLACSLRFGRALAEAHVQNGGRAPLKAYSLMLLVFAVLALNDIIAPAIVDAISDGLSYLPYYCGGAVLGIGLVLIYEKVRQTELYTMLNISFGAAALGFVAAALSLQQALYGPLAFILFGLSYAIGMIDIYYLAGFMAKKLGSVIFYRTGIVLSSLFYFAGITATGLMKAPDAVQRQQAVVMMAFAGAAVMLAMLLLTPFFIKNLSSREWMDDTYRNDITTSSRLMARLADYHLTPRECEACRLLLQGLTLRQIAGTMEIGFSTVNTYCNSIYRKMGINSRTELLIKLHDYRQ